MSIHDAPQARELKWLKIRKFLKELRDILRVIALLAGVLLILPVVLPIALFRPYKGDDFDGYC